MPKPARLEELRFAVSIPKGTMPEGGWPVVLYAHGTGGNYRTFVDEKLAEEVSEIKDDQGQVLTRLAMISIDQNLHGPRGTESPDSVFFNPQNPAASVHNVVQGGIDAYSLLRMVRELKMSRVVWGPKVSCWLAAL